MWIINVRFAVCHSGSVTERRSDVKAVWTVLKWQPDNRNTSLTPHTHTHTHTPLHGVLVLLTPSPHPSDGFSHPFSLRPPPTFLSLPLLPVDAPNKATCVVSGCLGERSPRQPAGRPCLPGDRLHACPASFYSPLRSSLPRFVVLAIRLSRSSAPSPSFLPAPRL